MRITIEGTLEQVIETCVMIGTEPILVNRRRSPKGESLTQKLVQAKRRLLHQAYVTIMNNPSEKKAKEQLARALAKGHITADALRTARRIVKARWATDASSPVQGGSDA